LYSTQDCYLGASTRCTDDVSPLKVFADCCSGSCTTSCVANTPEMHSTPFLNIVPSGFGFLGLYVILGKPPSLVLFGLHPLMDSSNSNIVVFSSCCLLLLNCVKQGKKISRGISLVSSYQYFYSLQQNNAAKQKALNWFSDIYWPKSG
jgi:hypothetical protein